MLHYCQVILFRAKQWEYFLMGPEEIREAANINCLIVVLKAFKVSMKKKIIIAPQQFLGKDRQRFT